MSLYLPDKAEMKKAGITVEALEDTTLVLMNEHGNSHLLDVDPEAVTLERHPLYERARAVGLGAFRAYFGEDAKVREEDRDIANLFMLLHGDKTPAIMGALSFTYAATFQSSVEVFRIYNALVWASPAISGPSFPFLIRTLELMEEGE